MTAKQQLYLVYGSVTIATAALIYIFWPKTENTGGTVDPTGNGTVNPGETTVFDAKKVAAELLEAMRYAGTETGDIAASLRSVNQLQFGQVVKAFGKQPYNKTLGNQITMPGYSLDKLDLKTWLKEELSSKEYLVWKLKYPNYL
jgi:hypothetical protein